ncbi:MAG TPA: AMP-binding protein [Solirubrobacteraceae bacterium]|nr:AMP-binding protein [Solirubrobacteraceae bacterium]
MGGDDQPGVRCGERFNSYEELFSGALRASTGLADLGVGAGDRVALLLRNSVEFLQASVATVPLGASAVPINWHWRGDEVSHVLADSRAKVLIVHDDLWPLLADAVPADVAVVLVRGGAGDPDRPAASPADGHRVESWPAWLAAHEPWSQAPESGPMSIIYTSGTTGRPKGVVRSPASEEQRANASELVAELFQLHEGERTLIPAPMYHTAPNVYALASAVKGLDMTIMTGFDPEEFLRLVETHRVSVVQMVPTMFVRLLALPQAVRERYDVSSLRWVVHAAAPCPADVKRAMIEWMGPIVVEYYGGTETGPVTFCTSEEWLEHPGSVGQALPGAVVKVFGGEGEELPPGSSGEVYMWHTAWPDFTYEGDEEKRRSVERDGLISCGDIGYMDEDGYLYLNDRASDMVISGGVNIYPAEIEACLLSLQGVRDCAVFGVPDDEFGEALAAHVEPHEGAELSEDDVRTHVRERLASYKTPRVIEFSSSLPREDSGKIFKRRLRDPYWQGRERAI